MTRRLKNRPRKGRRVVQEVAAHLEALGWLVVVSDGSRGPFDLVAFPHLGTKPIPRIDYFYNVWIGVSCRTDKSTKSESGWTPDDVRDVAADRGGKPVFVVRQSGRLQEGESRLVFLS